ncbi:SAM-dependent methyltransferase [Veronia nyctiphanis]|uniref:SAM-dependent methyltransferase n=1 Tax=Veronia nyctiphanis TaxID=1278244 RepID=A0A4V1LSG2_9GAMM|nr:class I SAM-dependent methyltransferase [Veronia nyctiphanis]RXJ71588.1 SAM-dependent methyltransferase [Veronia nyctiphanis]
MADAIFWNKIADKYAATPIANESVYQKKLAITDKYLTEQSEILEFGCGTGSTALIHAPKVSDYTALDTSARMIEIAQEKLQQTPQSNLTFVESTLENWQQAHSDTKYDVMLGLNVLHLMADYRQVIRQSFDMLKPGGYFITSSACFEGFSWWSLALPVMKLIGKAPHVEKFTAKQLMQAMLDAGFVLAQEWKPSPKGGQTFLVMQRPK